MDNQHHVKEMSKQETFTKVIVMPFHGQGHINPIFEFANRLTSKSNGTIHITIATTTSATHKLNKISSNMDVFTLYDDSNDDLRLDFWSHMEKFESKAPLQLFNQLSTSPIRPSLLVYDANLPWALNIAGLLGRPKSSDESSNGDKKLLHPLIKMVISFLTNLHQADWVLFNSFDRLDYEFIKWMENIWKVKTIGPLLPSPYLNKLINKGLNPYNPSNEFCMNWLMNFQCKFMWAIREIEQNKLPKDFINETLDKGLVLPWCPQLDVLAHESVGCFVTHCGSNSAIEAMCFGVPMLAMPHFMDQVINAYFVDQVWGVGVKAKANEKDLVTREEFMRCLEEIMDGERTEKIKKNVGMWKELARQAVSIGGSSDKNIDEIIDRLGSF